MKGSKYLRDRRKEKGRRRPAHEQTWELRVHTGQRKANGRPDVRFRTYLGCERDANKALDDFKREVEEGLRPDRRMTVAEYAEQWCKERQTAVRGNGKPYAGKTLSREASAVRCYIMQPPIGSLVLAAVDVPAIKRTIRAWRTGPRKDRKSGRTSPSTVFHVFSILDNILEAARADGKLRTTSNPCRELRPFERPSKPTPVIRALNADAALAMIDGLRGSEVGEISELSSYSGLRLGEVLGLGWQACDLEAGVVWVQQVVEQCLGDDGKPYARLRAYPKTDGSARDVWLPPQAIALLRRLKAAYNAKLLAAGMTPAAEHLVFSNLNISRVRRGLPWDPCAPWLPDEFSAWFYLRVGQTGLPRISFKNLVRATYATIMANNGTPTHVVQRMLGHTSTTVTMRHYLATLDESKKLAAAAFGESLERARRRASGEG
jgi:integrase